MRRGTLCLRCGWRSAHCHVQRLARSDGPQDRLPRVLRAGSQFLRELSPTRSARSAPVRRVPPRSPPRPSPPRESGVRGHWLGAPPAARVAREQAPARNWSSISFGQNVLLSPLEVVISSYPLVLVKPETASPSRQSPALSARATTTNSHRSLAGSVPPGGPERESAPRLSPSSWGLLGLLGFGVLSAQSSPPTSPCSLLSAGLIRDDRVELWKSRAKQKLKGRPWPRCPASRSRRHVRHAILLLVIALQCFPNPGGLTRLAITDPVNRHVLDLLEDFPRWRRQGGISGGEIIGMKFWSSSGSLSVSFSTGPPLSPTPHHFFFFLLSLYQ